ncbi:DUF5986 family protein [Schleiferilactobacillus harbinensis]|uniref:DUF5986 family protein n=1 Tax=Schleiferilactobacillus harbinensis TaxID=304207 RepID=UPI002672BC9F|nr:DUF5986 family protein [Schleiferilactobacillus harbinensis]
MDTNPVIINSIINTMRYTEAEFAPDFRAISEVNNNGRHAAVWARRGQMVTDDLAPNKSVEVLHIKRGGIWQFEAILDKLAKKLYIMISQKNLDQRRKEIEKNGYSTHYLYALLHRNCNLRASMAQLELLPILTEEQKNYREKDCDNMLADWADSVDEVIVAAFDYGQGMAVGATLYLFDENYNQVESQDISQLLVNPEKYASDKEPSLPHNLDDESQPLVTLRISKRTQQEQTSTNQKK